jgi:Mrp family chromosome partitioning ATPase
MTVARRHVLLIVALTLMLGVVAYVYSASKTPLFEASALLLYEPQLDVSNPLSQSYSDSNAQALQMQSAVTVITGPEISKRVDKNLGDPRDWPQHSVSAAINTSDVASSSSVGNGVKIAVTSPDPQWAARLANAYAQEFVDWRIETQRTRIAAAQAVISQKLEELQTPAQKASPDFIMLTERLRDLDILAAIATGNFMLVVPASPPHTPYAPQPRRSAAIGAFLGLGLGIVLALLREKLDTSLHNYRDVQEILHLPVIGRIPRIPEQALAKGPIVVVSDPDGRAAESLRVLRSNLEFASLGEENRVLMVLSALQGEGKSLVAANLAASLALAGKKVVLVDADLRRPRIHALFGKRNNAGVSAVIAGQVTLEDALQTVGPLGKAVVRMGGHKGQAQADDDDVGSGARLWLLTSGTIPPNPGEMVASRRFAAIIKELTAMPFDYVLIDSPAFIPVGDAAALAGSADGIILLVNMDTTKKPMLEEARDFLMPLPATSLGVVTVMDRSVKGDRYNYHAGT